MIASYLIPEGNVETARQKFAALVRRAAKLGVARPKLLASYHSACGTKQTILSRAVVWSAEAWATEEAKRAAKAERAAKKASRASVK